MMVASSLGPKLRSLINKCSKMATDGENTGIDGRIYGRTRRFGWQGEGGLRVEADNPCVWVDH